MALPTTTTENPRPRQVLRALLRLSLLALKSLLVAGLCFAALLVTIKTYYYHFGFGQQWWLAVGESLRGNREGLSSNHRARMVADVRAHYLQPNMMQTQVLALLGPADKTIYSFDFADSANQQNKKNPTKQYFLAPQPDDTLMYYVDRSLIDSIYLAILFDRNGRLISHWTYED